MNTADIIRLAREAGFTVPKDEWAFREMLESFAALVEAEALKSQQLAINAAVMAEREACAQICDDAQTSWGQIACGDTSPQYDYKADAAEELAGDIRSRTQPEPTSNAKT